MRKPLFKIILSILIVLTVFVPKLFAQTLSNWDLLNLFEQVKQTEPNIIKPYQIINLPQAWQQLEIQKPTPHPVTIGIADTGVDFSHQEFSGVNLNSDSPDIFIRLLGQSGHGTQVAGIIGANNISFGGQYISPQMNGIVSGFRGLNYQLLGKRALNSTWLGRLIKGVDKVSLVSTLENLAVSNPDIVNLSLGANYNNSQHFNNDKQIYEKFFNTYPKILFVTATNDSGLDTSKTLPAAIKLPNTITIAATDLNDNRATFTSGSSGFGSLVDLAAPGVGVYAPAPVNTYDKNFSGTSASASMVTGVAGLIKAIKPGLSPAEIKDILVKNADPIQTDKPIGGRLNALKAICDPLVGLNCVLTPPPPTALVWPMLQHDAQHTGLTDIAGPPFATSIQVNVKWQKPLGSLTQFPPLIDSNKIYVGAGLNLLAFNAISGNQIWQSSIPAGAINGALGPDGTIYVCGLDANQQSILTAVNSATGQVKWEFVVGQSRPCNSPVVDKNGVIYTSVPPAFNTQLAVAVAVNPDGTEKWRYEEGNIATTPLALSNDESQVYVVFFNRLLAFKSDTGQIVWTQNLPPFAGFPDLPVIDLDGRILILNPPIGNGFITAFSKSGALLWQKFSGAFRLSLYPNNRIVAVSLSDFSLLNTSDGETIPNSRVPFPTNSILLSSSAVVDANGLIYITLKLTDDSIDLATFDANGLRWTFGAPTAGFFAIGLNNQLYFTAQGILFSLGQ